MRPRYARVCSHCGEMFRRCASLRDHFRASRECAAAVRAQRTADTRKAYRVRLREKRFARRAALAKRQMTRDRLEAQAIRCELRRRAGLSRDPECRCNSCNCARYYAYKSRERRTGVSRWAPLTSVELGGPDPNPQSAWPAVEEYANAMNFDQYREPAKVLEFPKPKTTARLKLAA